MSWSSTKFPLFLKVHVGQKMRFSFVPSWLVHDLFDLNFVNEMLQRLFFAGKATYRRQRKHHPKKHPPGAFFFLQNCNFHLRRIHVVASEIAFEC